MTGFRPVFRSIAGVAIVAASMLALPAGANAQPTTVGAGPDPGLTHLYNVRYCEFLLVRQLTPTIQADVHNTLGLSNCPVDTFEAANTATIAAENGAITALKNGPNRWVLDSFVTRPAGDPIDMEGLQTRFIGTLSPSSAVPPAFVPIPISRSIVWNYRKGRTLRIFTSPGGRKYAMQSYSKAEGVDLKEADLNGLGSNPGTMIPEGWTFSTKKVKQKLLTLSTRGAPSIVRDGFGNVYQRFNWPRQK